MVTVYWRRWARQGGMNLHQAEHRAGLTLLAAGLSELYGTAAPPEALEEMLEKGARGKPYLPGRRSVHFNISHCGGLAVCAFAAGEVGADVEKPAPFSQRLPGKVLTADEREFLDCWGTDEGKRQELFFRLWTLKESLIKHSGEGLSRPLDSFSFQFPAYPDTGEIRCSQTGLYFVQQNVADGYILSVCTDTPIGELRLIPK